jgi:hypothetical protein
MGFRTAALSNSNATDASYDAWVNEIYNALIAFGWLQTSDTGSGAITSWPTTATRPSAINTYPNWAVFKMNDGNQTAAPVYMRLDFGTGSQTNIAAIKFQVAIGGSNGTGALTGNIITQITLDPASTTLQTCNMRTAGSSSSFRFAWLMEVGLNGTNIAFAVERDLDTSGVETSLGLNVLTMRSALTSQFLETAGGVGPLETRWYAMLSAQTTQAGGGMVGVGPVRCTLGVFRNPMKTVLGFAKTDFLRDTTNPVTLYGVSHTYLMMNAVFTISTLGWNTNAGFAFLWE